MKVVKSTITVPFVQLVVWDIEDSYCPNCWKVQEILLNLQIRTCPVQLAIQSEQHSFVSESREVRYNLQNEPIL